MQELVGELSDDVKERQTEVDGLQTALEKLRVGISDQYVYILSCTFKYNHYVRGSFVPPGH